MPGLTTWAHSCSAVVLPMRTISSPKEIQKQSHGCPCQGCKFSGTFRKLHPEPTPAHTGTLRNLPEPASGTYTSTSPAHAGTLRNLLEPAPEPTPAHPGTLRNLLEPSSGTCSCDPRRHTPELIWAEDPISLRCWGIIKLHQHRTQTATNHVSTTFMCNKEVIGGRIPEKRNERTGGDKARNRTRNKNEPENHDGTQSSSWERKEK